MARLPIPESDAGTWGGILNEYLEVSHNGDGTLKSNSVDSAAIQDNAVQTGKLDTAAAPTSGQVLGYNGSSLAWTDASSAAPDATTTSKGIVQLAGDLSGTAASPTVPQLADKADKVTVTGGTKTKITYNNQGVVTAGADATQDDIGDGVNFKRLSAAEQSKLSGIEDGATANSPDATLLNRANHTGTQLASTISDFNTAADARITSATGVTVEAHDADLTAIAALTPSNDDIIQRKSGAWTNRTPAQLKTDLALTKSDVGLSNVDNTSDADKPVSTATQTALNGKPSSTTIDNIVTLTQAEYTALDPKVATTLYVIIP